MSCRDQAVSPNCSPRIISTTSRASCFPPQTLKIPVKSQQITLLFYSPSACLNESQNSFAILPAKDSLVLGNDASVTLNDNGAITYSGRFRPHSTGPSGFVRRQHRLLFNRDRTKIPEETDDKQSQTSLSSLARASGRHRKAQARCGSPVRHSVKEVEESAPTLSKPNVELSPTPNRRFICRNIESFAQQAASPKYSSPEDIVFKA